MENEKKSQDSNFGISNSKYKYLIKYENYRPTFGDISKAMRFTRYEAYDMFNELERKGYSDLTVDSI
ncbi:hypothetical protein MKX40_22310 [Paenibacillus sp. FSL R5-0517]|uniref:hypothetical protein n=1 Tax=Paenibacillus sp. FSL R5-0517 TaxID=2921647 RepID=UPI0030D92B0A